MRKLTALRVAEVKRATLAAGLWVVACVTLGGCSTAQEIKRPNGKSELLIACGASTPWSVCYAEANRRCPQGYETLAEHGGFNRKEMRVACAEPKR